MVATFGACCRDGGTVRNKPLRTKARRSLHNAASGDALQVLLQTHAFLHHFSPLPKPHARDSEDILNWLCALQGKLQPALSTLGGDFQIAASLMLLEEELVCSWALFPSCSEPKQAIIRVLHHEQLAMDETLPQNFCSEGIQHVCSTDTQQVQPLEGRQPIWFLKRPRRSWRISQGCQCSWPHLPFHKAAPHRRL